MGDDLPDYELGIAILKQELASLAAIVTAVDLDIRNLAAADIAHLPLPYNYKQCEWTLDSNLAYRASDTITFTEADWGTGLNFYPVSMILLVHFRNDGYNLFFHNIEIEMFENDGEDTIKFFNKAFTPLTHPRSSAGDGYLSHLWTTEKIPENRIDSDKEFEIEFYNNCGQQIDSSDAKIFVVGTAV